MLHHTQKKAAIKKYANHESDAVADVREAIKNEYPDATDEDIDDVMKSLKEPVETKPPLSTAQIMPGGMAPNPNDKIRDSIKDFDYSKMVGEDFKKYCLFVQTLQDNDAYFFENYLVEVVKKVRYRGVKDSPTDVIGFRLVNTTPIHTTKIPVKVALINNGRVRQDEGENFFETIGSQIEHNGKNGRYYLLKK